MDFSKYLPVLVIVVAACFISTKADAPVTITKYICENNTQVINCTNNVPIQIVSAIYGRSAKRICPPFLPPFPLSPAPPPCASNTSSSIVSALCNNKPNCTLYANNTALGDPCAGVVKYLEVQYQCPPTVDTQYTAIACENTSLIMSCPANHIIQTVFANYGYRNSTVCPGVSNVVDNCNDPNSVQIVINSCEDRNSCVLYSSPSIFGTACSGATPSYLEASYRCVPTATPTNK